MVDVDLFLLSLHGIGLPLDLPPAPVGCLPLCNPVFLPGLVGEVFFVERVLLLRSDTLGETALLSALFGERLRDEVPRLLLAGCQFLVEGFEAALMLRYH